MGASVLFLAACGEGADTAPPGTGGAGGTSSSTSASGMASSSGTGGAGGAGGTGGDSFCSGATKIDFGEVIDGDLATTGQQDFYRFMGKKGQVVQIDIDAQGLDDAEYDPTYLDAVVTLFDADGAQIAQNDNPIEYSTEDSRLYTILPADGEYCARVAECWTAISNPVINCAKEKDKLVTSYTVWFYEFVDAPGDALTVEVEAGNDAKAATAIEYAKDGNGLYTTTFWGTFEGQDDIDVFSFTMPMDLTDAPPADVRTAGRFYIMPSGPNESGATAATGKVQVVEASAPGMVLAEIDAIKNPRFAPRLELGTPYLLFVTRPKGMTLSNDFYFVRHYPSWGNPLELEKGVGANDTPATAEVFTIIQKDGYIEGDLTMDAQDVDHFLATVPSGVTMVSAGCTAQRYGSGLRGLKLSLLAADGNPLANDASDTETEMHFASVSDVPLGGATQVVLKIEAASQAPTVTGAFYQCGIHFLP